MEVEETSEFSAWFNKLKEPLAIVRINTRIARIKEDNFFGDAHVVQMECLN